MTAADAAGAIENPVTGERIEIRERDPGVLRFDYRLAPGGFAIGRLDHTHPYQVEQFRLRSGRLRVRVDGEEWTATEGEQFTIPANTPHTVWNDSRQSVHAVVELRPALDTASFFETTYGLAREGKTNEWGLPGPLQLAVLVDAYADELHLAAAPRSVQLGVAALLAPIGRALGYRASYPRFRSEPREATVDASGR